ncbi:MAG TPA: hypothetical protein VKQ05_06655 [Gemmatimonadales bacterium]|nr:hypothetical protein [Gemmatimonadales bacterium]
MNERRYHDKEMAAIFRAAVAAVGAYWRAADGGPCNEGRRGGSTG